MIEDHGLLDTLDRLDDDQVASPKLVGGRSIDRAAPDVVG
jgi:hypothetical protein